MVSFVSRISKAKPTPSRPHLASIRIVCGIAVATLLGGLPVLVADPAPAAGAGPTVTVSPASGIHSGQQVRVSVTDEAPGTTLLAVECSPQAISIGEDGCENGSNAVFFAAKSGKSAELRVFSTISTAVGDIKCGCLVAVVTITGGNVITVVGFTSISFVPGDASPGEFPPQGPPWTSPPGVPTGTILLPGGSDVLNLHAGVAGNLTSPGAITGPGVTLARDAVPVPSQSGVALLQLVLAAPGTSWASTAATAVVVNVGVDNGPIQQIVLFAGSRPFTYAAEFGDLSTGTQRVTLTVSSALSTTGKQEPEVRVIAERLSIVAPSNPEYWPMQFAPIVYGRPDTASSDTPLLTYAQVTMLAGGVRHIENTTIWSKEDAGTSFVPWLEWGEWGRMTDITETTQLDVSANGVVSDAMYDSCGCAANYPVNRTSPLEAEVKFAGLSYGTHMIVRNASGNDYQSDTGTSAFRIEQPPIPGPAPGMDRDSVMDLNPWTYRVSAQELSRWYADATTSPFSPEIGDSRQYAILDLNMAASGTDAVGVAIQLKGSPTWYSSEFGGDFALYSGGVGRTVVKLPENWETTPITGVRLYEYPLAGKVPSLKDITMSIIGLSTEFAVVRPSFPAPVVVRA